MLHRLPGQARERVVPPAVERLAFDRLPRVAYEIDQEAQIMQAQEAQAEDLLLIHEMPDVRAAERRARGAAAGVVQRARVARKAGVPQVEAALPRERAAAARGARRQHAVEHVDAARDDLDQ